MPYYGRTPEEKAAKKLRDYEKRRIVKQGYVHKDFLHGPFFHPGDALLKRFLQRVDGDGPILASCNERHLKKIEDDELTTIWHTERPVDPDDVLLGRVARQPEASGPLDRLKFSQPLAGAFVCERVQQQLNLNRYLIALRETVIPGGSIALVVPNAHHELVDDHVNLFTAGTLVYNLVRAGWNCRQAAVNYDKRFINLIVHREDVPQPWPTRIDDIVPFVPFRSVFQYCTSEFVEVYKQVP